MSKQSKGGGGNMLLLAGLGVGAFMLLSKKSNAQTDAPSSLPQGSGAESDIPEPPKILAVNNSSTESPAPTGIVSDEEGMEVARTTQPTNPNSTAQLPAADADEEDDASAGAAAAGSAAGTAAVRMMQNAGKVPAVISTKLTPKEQAVVSAGRLTAELALKRPDLYKAAYIKKYGGATTTGKRKALTAATLAIDAAVNAAGAAKNGALAVATKYPAKPEHTFVQTAGGMMAQTAVAKVAALQKAGVKVSPAAQKVSAGVKAAKGSKGRHPVKPTRGQKARPPKKRAAARPATPVRAVRPVKPQRPTTKRR